MEDVRAQMIHRYYRAIEEEVRRLYNDGFGLDRISLRAYRSEPGRTDVCVDGKPVHVVTIQI